MISKTFKQYLAESVHTYKYKLKIAGDADKQFLDQLLYNIKSKFAATKIGEPRRTPIQRDPFGFPELKNESITIVDVDTKYPMTEPMVQQMAQLLGYNVNWVRLITAAFDDSINAEADGYANQESHSPVLTHEQLEDAGKSASEEYANSYLDRALKDKDEVAKRIPYAAKKTPTQPDPNVTGEAMRSQQKQSPLSNIKRPARPETGASAGAKFKK